MMWFESQNCAMMGLETTNNTTPVGAGKRKLDVLEAEAPPAKNARWELPTTAAIPATSTTSSDDCIARLRAVAVPAGDVWRAPTPSLTLTLIEEEFDDDEFEDELSDDERCAAVVPPPTVVPSPAVEPPRFATPVSLPAFNRYQSQEYWQYNPYQQTFYQQQQQTIRCDENGKSYFMLGASPPPARARTRCCDGRTRWCQMPCNRQKRLAVINLSMCKLAQYKQTSDPSLVKSVLICNMLRRLEREMEAETEPPEPSYPAVLPEMTPPTRPYPVAAAIDSTTNNNNNNGSSFTTNNNYEQSLRDMTCSSGRATPFPSNGLDTDSGLGDMDDDDDDYLTRPINWKTVLGFTSESLNNNEFYAELGLSNSEPNWGEPSTSRTDSVNDWDDFGHMDSS